MRYLKMLGLAAVAAMALMAFVGVGSASAVTLCENNTATGCTSHVNSGKEIDFSAEDSIKLAGPFGITIVTCTESTVKVTTSSTGSDNAAAIGGTVTSLTFAKCTRPVTVGTGGTLSMVESGAGGNGTVTSSGATVTIHEIPNIVGNPPTCSYITSNTDIGTLTASATAATFDIAATITSATDKCPNGTWSGHYVSTGPTVIKAVAH